MADNVTNELLLEHMKAMQAELAQAQQRDEEMLSRLANLEIGIARLRRDQAGDAEAATHVGIRLDRAIDRIDRIERRLQLTEGE